MIKEAKGGLVCAITVTLVLCCTDKVSEQGIWAGPVFLFTQMCKLC